MISDDECNYLTVALCRSDKQTLIYHNHRHIREELIRKGLCIPSRYQGPEEYCDMYLEITEKGIEAIKEYEDFYNVKNRFTSKSSES